MVWLVPGVHWKVQGDVQALASTVSAWPVAGAVVIVETGRLPATVRVPNGVRPEPWPARVW